MKLYHIKFNEPVQARTILVYECNQEKDTLLHQAQWKIYIAKEIISSILNYELKLILLSFVTLSRKYQ